MPNNGRKILTMIQQTETVTKMTLPDGTVGTRDSEGRLHSINDQPALILAYGVQVWYHHDEVHRDNDLPAMIMPDGTQVWCQHDEVHRDNDLPAIIRPDGSKEYWQHGVLIRMEHNDKGISHDTAK